MSPSSRGVVLDHSAYPHLMDHIFRLADAESLVQLRLVSRSFLAKADALLAYHVYFAWTFRTPFGEFTTGVDYRPVRHRLPGLPPQSLWRWCSSDRRVWRHASRYATILRNTRVMDFVSGTGTFEASTAGVRLSRALVNVDTVRHRVGYQQTTFRAPIQARRVIIQIDLYDIERSDVPDIHLGVTGPPSYGVEKLVLHIACTCRKSISPPVEIVSAFCGASLQEIVVIFDPYDPRREGNDDEPQLGFASPSIAAILPFIPPIAAMIPDVKVKFVNLDELYPSPPLGDTNTPALPRHQVIESDFRERILNDVSAAMFPSSVNYPSNTTAEDLCHCERVLDESVSFLTHEAYGGSVAPADYVLEAFLDQWIQ